ASVGTGSTNTVTHAIYSLMRIAVLFVILSLPGLLNGAQKWGAYSIEPTDGCPDVVPETNKRCSLPLSGENGRCEAHAQEVRPWGFWPGMQRDHLERYCGFVTGEGPVLSVQLPPVHDE